MSRKKQKQTSCDCCNSLKTRLGVFMFFAIWLGVSYYMLNADFVDTVFEGWLANFCAITLAISITLTIAGSHQ